MRSPRWIRNDIGECRTRALKRASFIFTVCSDERTMRAGSQANAIDTLISSNQVTSRAALGTWLADWAPNSRPFCSPMYMPSTAARQAAAKLIAARIPTTTPATTMMTPKADRIPL
jgi:hypothetical protein